MYKTWVDQFIIDHSKAQVATVNFGAKKVAESGNKRQQIIGKIGENRIKEILGLRLALEENDNGYDLTLNGYKVDVKTIGTTGYPKPSWYVYSWVHQDGYICDIYLFTYYNIPQRDLIICGYAGKKEFMEVAEYKQKGQWVGDNMGHGFNCRGAGYFARIFQIRQINNIGDLRGIAI